MKPKRILMIIPNLGFGGAQRVFHDISVALATQHTVVECVFNVEDGHAFPSGNELVSLNVPAGRNPFHKLYCFFLRVHRLRKLKQKLNVDCAISHLEGADYVNVLSTRGEKTILCIHGSKKYDRAIRGAMGWVRKNILIKILYKHASRIVTVAQGIANELQQDFSISPAQITVVPNAIDLKKIQDLSRADSESFEELFDKPVVITHGRLAPEKNQALLIALAARPELRGKIKTVIIGDGPLLDELVDHAKSLNLRVYDRRTGLPLTTEADVYFLGFLSNPFGLLRRSSIFAFPSLFEGMPMALIEAMACGLPVIARDCPYGPAEVLNPAQQNILQNQRTEFGILIPASLSQADEVNLWCSNMLDVLNSSANNELRQASLLRAAAYGINNFQAGWLRTVQDV